MDKDKKQEYLIKFCCFIAAFALWLYISSIQNPIKIYKLRNVPVQMVNTDAAAQSKFVVMPHQELSVTLTIKGAANDVYAVRPEQFKVVADLSAYALKKGENRILVEIKESPTNVSIVTSEVLWVKVSLDDLVEKSVPVKVEVTGKAKEGYAASDPIAKPTDALISGPAQYVNSVKNVVAKADIKNSDKDLTATLPLKALDAAGRSVDEVKIQPTITEVVVPIRRVKTVGINVKTTGKVSKDITISPILPVVEKIDIAGKTAVIDPIQALDTEPIDLSTINENTTTVQAKLIVPKDVTLVGSKDIIAMKVTVNKIAQKTVTLDVQYKNLQEDYEAVAESTKVSVTLSGAEAVLNGLKQEDISCYLDLNSLNEGENSVPVTLQLPDGVSKMAVNPQNVKVTIKKKVKG